MDLTHARLFIKSLTGSEDNICNFRTFDDTKDRKKGSKIGPVTISDSIHNACTRLESENSKGAGIFVTINVTDGEGLSAANITAIRALFIDFDDGRQADDVDFHLQPTIITKSAGGCHAYWVMQPGQDRDLFRCSQERLLTHYKTDPLVKDLPRVMRLPGSMHNKRDPVLVECVRAGDEKYTIDEVMDGLPAAEEKAERPLRELVKIKSTEELEALKQRLERAETPAAKYFAKVDALKEGQGRDNKAYALLMSWRKLGVRPTSLIDMLDEHWNQRNTPPLLRSILEEKAHRIEKDSGEHFDAAPPDHDCVQTYDKPKELYGVPVWVPGGEWGYHIHGSSIHKNKVVNRKQDGVKVSEVVQYLISKNLMLFAGRKYEIHTGIEHMQVCWKNKDGSWSQIEKSSRSFQEFNKLLELTDYGLPITSRTERDIVDYFLEMKHANHQSMPTQLISEQMGWQKHDKTNTRGFLLGQKWIPSNKGGKEISFSANQYESTSFAHSITTSGTLDGWRQAIDIASKYPRAMLAVIGSLCPILLDITESPNFLIDWCYRTSSGKTTAMKLAASVYGVPDERKNSLIGTWDSTEVYIERSASLRNGLPVILDETKRAKNKQFVSRIGYMIANGQGRGRGKKSGGVQQMQRFRTVLLTTGEDRMVDATTDGGLSARTITIWGPVFGEQTDATGADIEKINQLLRQNYGHAAALFVEYMIANKSEVMAEVAKMQDYIDMYAKQAEGQIDKGQAYRRAEFGAVLRVTEEIMRKALGIKYACDTERATDICIVQSGEELDASRREEQALEHVVMWADSCRGTFRGQETVGKDVLKWSGVWADNGPMGVHLNVLEEILEKKGHCVKSVLKLWKDTEVIDIGEGGKTTKQVRYDGKRHRCVVFPPEVVSRILGEECHLKVVPTPTTPTSPALGEPPLLDESADLPF